MSLWTMLQGAEAIVVARVRAAIFVLGALGAAEAQNIADGLAWPESAKWLRRAFTVCAGIALLLRAGDKTPEDVKIMADRLSQQGKL